MALINFKPLLLYCNINYLIIIVIFFLSFHLIIVMRYRRAMQKDDEHICYFQFLTKKGIYDFWNWFDDRTWYFPLSDL